MYRCRHSPCNNSHMRIFLPHPHLEIGRAVELAKLHEWFQTILTAPTSSYNRHPPCRLLHHPPGNGKPLLI